MGYLLTWNGEENFCTVLLNRKQKYNDFANCRKLQDEVKLTTVERYNNRTIKTKYGNND